MVMWPFHPVDCVSGSNVVHLDRLFLTWCVQLSPLLYTRFKQLEEPRANSLVRVSSFNKHSCVARSYRHKESTQSARWPRFGRRVDKTNSRSIIHLPPRLKTHFLLYVVLQLKLHRRGGKLDRPCCVQLYFRSGSIQFPVFTPLFCVMMLSALLFKGKAKLLLKIMIVIEILWSFPLWWTRKYKKHWISRDGKVIFFSWRTKSASQIWLCSVPQHHFHSGRRRKNLTNQKMY